MNTFIYIAMNVGYGCGFAMVAWATARFLYILSTWIADYLNGRNLRAYQITEKFSDIDFSIFGDEDSGFDESVSVLMAFCGIVGVMIFPGMILILPIVGPLMFLAYSIRQRNIHMNEIQSTLSGRGD